MTAFDDLLETVRRLTPGPVLRTVLISPDVWDKLHELAPHSPAEPDSVWMLGVLVRVLPELGPGTIVPLDQHGNPMPRTNP